MVSKTKILKSTPSLNVIKKHLIICTKAKEKNCVHNILNSGFFLSCTPRIKIPPNPLWSETRGGLTSATRSGDVGPRALGSVHRGEILGTRGVNPYGGVEVGLGGAQPHGEAKPLSDLSCVRAQVVVTNHTLLCSEKRDSADYNFS